MISIVLVEPENPGNIGAIARSMKNFDFSELVMIDPKCSIGEDAHNRAKHAQEVLDGARVADWSVLEEFDYVVGTTSKIGRDYNIPRNPVTPEELFDQVDVSKKIAVLIGRESDGLHNSEIEKCDFIVAIPTSKEYPALNISHAVTIILYEFYKKFGSNKIDAHIEAISKTEKDQLMKMVGQVLDGMEFATDQDRETQEKVWKRLVGKSFMSKREAFALMGFLRKLL
ncbi:RNA methyltransferase [Thermoproteota archaeon]